MLQLCVDLDELVERKLDSRAHHYVGGIGLQYMDTKGKMSPGSELNAGLHHRMLTCAAESNRLSRTYRSVGALRVALDARSSVEYVVFEPRAGTPRNWRLCGRGGCSRRLGFCKRQEAEAQQPCGQPHGVFPSPSRRRVCGPGYYSIYMFCSYVGTLFGKNDSTTFIMESTRPLECDLSTESLSLLDALEGGLPRAKIERTKTLAGG